MLILPIPPKELNPNVKIHFQKKAKFFASYKMTVFRLARVIRPTFNEGKIHLFITLYPPNNNRRDADNFLSSFKAGIDGIASAWDIDDRRFNPITVDILDKVEDGKIIVKYLQKPVDTESPMPY